MLARSETINLPYGKPLVTPVLLPSFSSKGFPELRKILNQLEQYISGQVLFSAYDVEHEKIPKKIPFAPELLFIDSGGYECSAITDFVEYNRYSYKPKPWNIKLYFDAVKSVLRNNIHMSKVIVSYDNPRRRRPVNEQIKFAKSIFKEFSKIDKIFFKEIILKPETSNENEQYISIDAVIQNIEKLKTFNIIGFTEKELGTTLIGVMINICKIRKALNRNKMRQLIHIFGSLDPISTPLYFMCGADIFDGLTWLRYSFYQGLTIYQQNYWFEECPLDSEVFALRMRSAIDNLSYLSELRFDMMKFQKNKDFTMFRYNKELLKRIWDTVEAHI